MDKETKKQLLLIEKTVYRIEKDTIELRKKLDAHIEDVWTVYKPIKNTNVNDPNNYTDSNDAPYILRTETTQYRFVTRFIDSTTLQIQFGSGTVLDNDEEVIPNPDNVGLASKAIDLYKLESGIKQSSPKRRSNQVQQSPTSAADMVSTKTTNVEPKSPKIWTETEIAKMSLDQFDRLEDEIRLAQEEGRIRKG